VRAGRNPARGTKLLPEPNQSLDLMTRRGFGPRSAGSCPMSSAVLYSIEPDFVLIIAVMHCHREPGYWQHRLG
jgi:hypothetical protein